MIDMDYVYTREEQETIINYNQAGDTASVYTYNPTLIRKLDRLAEEYDCVIKESGTGASRSYIIPKKWVKINPPRKMSDENKQKAAERLKKAREAKTNES